MPPGAFVYRRINRDRILQELEESVRTLGPESPYYASRLFGANRAECELAIQKLKEFAAQLRWR